MSEDLHDLLAGVRVVPVVTVTDERDAVPLAHALAAGGLGVIEITLRTPQAVDAIRSITAELPEVVVGAGTIRTRQDIDAAVTAGARFLVSPGSTPNLLDALEDTGVPYLPGAATASEVMAVSERGVRLVKFFPAEAAGGATAVAAMAGPFPDVMFCPTGGIHAANARTYLALSNVACVGGSWMLPRTAIAARNFATVTRLAGAAA